MITYWNNFISDTKDDEKKREWILTKLTEAQVHAWGCRYTGGEIRKLANFWDSYQLEMDDRQYQEAKSKTIGFEFTLIKRLLNNSKSDIKQQVKTANQKLERKIEQLKRDYETHQEITSLQARLDGSKAQENKQNEMAKKWKELQKIL